MYLTAHRYLRIASFTLFYLAQGLPIGIISIALPAWLAEQGAAPAQIAAFVAISGLPWGFKLFAGPLMDRFSFLAMGRRRPWVILAQGGLLGAMCLMGTTPDPVNNLTLLTWLAFCVNACAAIQDVAVDGMAIDVLPEDERGRANAFMAFGQVAGYSGSAAVAAWALVNFGLMGATWMLATGVLFIFAWSILVRERQGERLLPWSEGGASDRSIALQATDWTSIFSNLLRVMFLPASLLLIVVTLFWRIQAGFWITATPIIVVSDLGYASTDYSNWTATAGFVAACSGLVFGPLIDKTGTRTLLLCALFGLVGLHLSVYLLTDLWSISWFPLAVLFADSFLSQIAFICFIALHMNICWDRVSATQFAIYMAWANLARSIGAWIYGQASPWLETPEVFLVMGLSALVAALLLLMVNLDQHRERIDNLQEIKSRPPAGSRPQGEF